MAGRGATMQFRISEEEKIEIGDRARQAGYESVSEFVREAALGNLEPAPPILHGAKLLMDPIDEDQLHHLEPPAPLDGRTEAEVEEAKLQDENARVAFVKRRTAALHAQGRTTPVAEREAEAEWRNRGNS